MQRAPDEECAPVLSVCVRDTGSCAAVLTAQRSML